MAIQNEAELEFIIFAVENTANRLSIPANRLYTVLRQSGLLQDYLEANYEVLHTQDKEYIINDLLDVMKERGIAV